MTYTAQHEHYGSSNVDAALAASRVLPLPTYPGGARLCVYTTTGGGIDVSTPDATELQVGGRRHYTVLAKAGSGFTLKDADGGTITAVAAGEAVKLWLADNSTSAGEWLYTVTTFASGTALNASRQPIEYWFGTSVTGVALDTFAEAVGWDGSSPVAIKCTILSDVVVSGTLGGQWALSTGDGFPAGSTMLLVLQERSYIAGTGGSGGYGQSDPAATNGGAGGDGNIGLATYIDTALVNYGTIQGGGGGGGGGSAATGVGGGGGGGGAGYPPSYGGSPGGPSGAFGGGAGSLTIPGGGGTGANSGGAGGIAGVAGSDGSVFGAGAGSGGARGIAVYYKTGITWNKIVAGNIYVDEVAF